MAATSDATPGSYIGARLKRPDGPPKLAGEASLVIELDLTLFSHTVTVSSGTYELIGGDGFFPLVGSAPAPEAYEAAQREVWDNYWRAFA